jgi:hypothetical protein
MEFTVDNVFKLLKKSLTIFFLQDTMDNRVPMMRLNPVTDGSNCVDRGLFRDNIDVYQLLATQMFKKILLTDATTEDGEDEVTKYFKVQKEWNCLLDEWHANQRDVIGYERYYELLFLVKSKSEEDYIWFIFFEGMHCHAAIITSLLCSKFNHSTNELIPGSLTMEQFRSGSIKYFKDPGTTVSNHLNQIMASQFEAPMFDNQLHVSAYIPKRNV